MAGLTVDRFAGTEASVKDNVRSTQQVAKAFDCKSFEFASTTEQMEALWSARKQALWASLAIRPEGTEVWSTDVAVPLSRMAELIGE
jgi:D-lactate dehydrogenase (cytochrome)